MYNEKNSEFSIRDIVLQLLFVVLFVFILLWLFPTKTDVNKLSDKLMKNKPDSSLDILFDRIFNENMFIMKDATKDYFTKERVPKKIGDKVTITLGEMLDKKLLLPFVDKDGKQCDLTRSYVEVTKINNVEYTAKINLDCNDGSDYILVPMGCYDFCETSICEKPVAAPVTSSPSAKKDPAKPVPAPKPTPKPTPTPKPEPKTEYLYEYVKVVPQSYSAWGNWSNWSTTKKKSSELVEVNTKTVENPVKKHVATTKITQDVPYMDIEQVHIDNLIEKKCVKWGTKVIQPGTVAYGNEWIYSHMITSKIVPQNTATIKYIEVKNPYGNPINCKINCKPVGAIYKVYKKQPYVIKESVYTCLEYDLKVTPIYISSPVTKYKTEVSYEPVYGYVIEKIPYYQFRTRTIIKGYTDIKWSNFNDNKLVKAGYQYTGNRKEIK